MEKETVKKKGNFLRGIAVNAVLGFVVLGIFAAALVPGFITTAYNPDGGGAIYRGNPNNKNVALMFNVYWGTEYLDGILDVLDAENVKLTFFVGGSWAAKENDMLIKIKERGHELANHGYYHQDHKQIGETRNREEIYVTHKLVEEVAGVTMNLFAPPSGSFSKTTLSVAASLGYKVVMWSRDTIDWRDKDAEITYSRGVKNMKNGDLVLMHPTAHTLSALPRIIKTAKEQGFKVTTVTETIA